MKPIRIVIADDHALVRSGLRSLIEAYAGMEVVAEVSNGREAILKVRELRPEIVLLDISMPELNGLDAAARISRQYPRTRAVIVSMHASEDYVLEALRAGAAGYILKNAEPEEFEKALRSVAAGERYLPQDLSAGVVGRLLAGHGQSSPLTQRQREILQLIAEGTGTRDIAGKLSLSVKTVEAHRAQLMQRLGIHEVAGLTRYAIRAGLISLEVIPLRN